MQGVVSQVNIAKQYGSITGGHASGAGLQFFPECVRGDVPFDELKGKKVYYEEGRDATRGHYARYVKPV